MTLLGLVLDHPFAVVGVCFAVVLGGLTVLAVYPERALHLDLGDCEDEL